MREIFRFLEGIVLFYLLFVFLRWYIKGHFGKYFILFWLYTIFAIWFHFHKNELGIMEYGPTHEFWKDQYR